jgi:hypothetical protein
MGLPVGAQEDAAGPGTQTPAAQGEKNSNPSDDPAQKAPPNPPAPSETAKKLFQEAREKLGTHMYKARIVQKLYVPNRTLEAFGEIIRGQKFRMRLEFEIKSGATVGHLLQVCTGDKLWSERRVNDVPRLMVQDVKEILNKAGEARENLVVAELGLGGITALLASIERTMSFGDPQSVEIDGEQLVRVDGVWNEAFLNRMKANPQLTKGLPDYIPDGARVYFDSQNFPRRIQYLKKEPKHEAMRPVASMDFLDVVWLSEADVKPSLFEYEPPEKVYPEDVTKSYVDQLQARPAPAPPKP